MIEDEELRLLYKTSSNEHLQKLESDLMILEKNPQDTAALEEFLREAHTLKGDSRMLGLDEIEMLVHQLEDCMEGIKAGHSKITAELCDRLYQGIDAINQLSHQAITGESTSIDPVAVLASLMDLSGNSPAATEPDFFGDGDDNFFDDEDDFFGSDATPEQFTEDLFADEPSADESSFAVPTIASPKPEELVATPVINQDYQIDTIRVEPQKLDTLMTQASELSVTRLRIS